MKTLARRFLIQLMLGLVMAAGLIRTAGQNNSTPPNVLLQLMQSQMPVDLNSPVTVKAEFDPPFVAVGQKAIYRVTLNALEAAIKWPEQIPLPRGLNATPSSRGQIMPVLDGMFRPQTALNFHVIADRPGFYTIPGFAFEAYGKAVRVPPAVLEVTPAPSEDQVEPRQLFLLPARTNLFVGESLSVRVIAPGTVSNLVDTLTQLQFNGDGFLDSKNITHQQMEAITIAGKLRQAWVVESSVTPVAAGSQMLSAQAFTGGLQFAGPVVLRGQISLLGGAQRNVLLDSDPVVINVQPLPPEGNAKGFTGFIGQLSVDRPQLSTNSLRIGDVLTLRVTFRGQTSFSRFTPPPAPRVAGWQVFPPTPTDPAAAPQPVPPYAVAFMYAMIPASEDVSQTPAIPFHYFDPETAAYVDATIPALDVKVQPGDLPADWKTASAAFSESPANRKITLSPMAATPGRRVATLVPLQLQGWFGWLQLAPALLFGALWYWDRRRRFLEAHPEVVRCREARRALRRERRALRQAAARGDATGFVRRSVAAMQVAAAPHFPAAPRALVCGEVLSLFDATEQGGRTGEIIRQFFAREMDTTYSAKPEQAMPLFDLRPEMESILTKMEARL